MLRGQRGQGAVTSHTAQQQDGGSTEGPGGRGGQSGVGGRVTRCEKMPLHQLSEGLLITRPGGEERWGGGWVRSRGVGGGWGVLLPSLPLNRSAGTR